MTATIYARVDEELKDAVDDYRREHGLSLTSAVAELLGRGLEAAGNEDSVGDLEVRLRELQGELARIGSAAGQVDGRMAQVLGTCRCGRDLTGRDLLMAGRCPGCNRGVTGLLTGAAADTDGVVNRTELTPFVAGVGVALALILLAYATSKEA